MMDANFDGSVVYLTEVTDTGAAGVVLNRPTDIPVAAVLPELAAAAAPPDVVFHGGPVAEEYALVLAAGSEGLALLGAGEVEPSTDRLRVFAGYAGWDAGQLEAEIAQRAWFVLDGSEEDVLTSGPESLWRAVFARQTGRLRRYRSYPDDPSLN